MVEIEKELLDSMVKTMKDSRDFMKDQTDKMKNIEAIGEIEIKPWGNSAHIPVSRKFIGYKAEVRVLKKEEKKK